MNQQDGEHRGGGAELFICSVPIVFLSASLSARPAGSLPPTTKQERLLAARCVISTWGNLAKAVCESLRPPRCRRQLQFMSSNFFVLSFTWFMSFWLTGHDHLSGCVFSFLYFGNQISFDMAVRPCIHPHNGQTIQQSHKRRLWRRVRTDGDVTKGRFPELCVSAHTNQTSLVREDGGGGHNVLRSSLTGWRHRWENSVGVNSQTSGNLKHKAKHFFSPPLAVVQQNLWSTRHDVCTSSLFTSSVDYILIRGLISQETDFVSTEVLGKGK